MADYVDIRETYMVAGDFDSRKRYIRKRTGGSLAVCSGVTWSIGDAAVVVGSGFLAYQWSLGPRGSASHSLGALTAPVPTPIRVTDCVI